MPGDDAPAPTIAPVASGGDLRRVAPLFAELYRHLDAVAGRPLLRDDGFAAWIGLYDKVAGRSRIVLCADGPDGPVGFVEGLLRNGAPYAPPGVAGFIPHLFVAPGARGHGIAAALVAALRDWFASKGVNAIELQVVEGNDPALRFWRAQGFAVDLHQMRVNG